MKTVGTRVSDEVYRKLQEKANELNMTVSDLLRQLIVNFLEGKVKIKTIKINELEERISKLEKRVNELERKIRSSGSLVKYF